MKINIKSLLTGTTLFVASASSIDAVPPKDIGLIDGATITHPIFGKMEVISHKEDIKYYDEHNKGHDLVEDFMEYVLNPNSYEKYEIDKNKVKEYAEERIARTRAGVAMLKVITANYMREYDRIKQFCEQHKKDLEAYREESLKHTEYVKILLLREKLKRFYDVEVSFARAKSCNDVNEKEMSVDDLLKLYKRFQSGELETMEVGDLLKEVLDLNDDWKVVKERCDCQLNIERHYPKAFKEFFTQHGDVCKKICDAYSSIKEWEKSDDIQKLISLGKVLEQAYEAETKAENEKRFSLIRRKNIPACDFLTLYEHFFEEKSEIKDINGILFHTLTLKKEHRDPGFGPLASGEFIILPKIFSSSIKNYWIDSEGRFKAKEVGEEAIDVDEIHEECGALHHELLHFMNTICWPTQEEIGAKDIQKNDALLKQLQKEFGENSGYIDVLNRIYDNSLDMWTMYGILYVPNPENKDKGEFYYDPINEAVADAEVKILVTIEEEEGGFGDESVICSLVENEEHLVRTGHGLIMEYQVSYVKKLNEMWGIYSFYFNKGEELRELIGK